LDDWSADIIHLPSSALKQLKTTSQKDDGSSLARVVFFMFKNLHQLMADADQQLTGDLEDEKLVLNSRIISVLVIGSTSSNSDNKLKDPVTMTFTHLQKTTANVNEIVCSFWDPEKDAWSNLGCRVRGTNSSHTDCECDHLTSFALLVSSKTLIGSEVMRSMGSGILFDNSYSFGSDLEVNNSTPGTATRNVLSLEIATYLVSSVCVLILILIVVQVKSFLT